MKFKKIKPKCIIILLIILLVIAGAYICYDKYSEKKEKRELEIYMAGMQEGYAGAILEIMNKAVNCEQVPLFADNQTINLIAIECLQLAEGQ